MAKRVVNIYFLVGTNLQLLYATRFLDHKSIKDISGVDMDTVCFKG